MRSLWNDADAARHTDPLALRAYSSRLLGAEEDLVLHGGGNTSLKTRETDFCGDSTDVLWVKGSGWDLKTIAPAGFAPVRMRTLLAMGARDTLTDTLMVKEQRAAMLDPDAPLPSIEAVLHALIPLPWVDHTHADAVVALSNSPGGEERLRSLYGDRVFFVPYVMPGFELAKVVQRLLNEHDATAYEGMVLMHHGIFSWGDSARESYERMIALVDAAEQCLSRHHAWDVLAAAPSLPPEPSQLATLRQAVSEAARQPMVARVDASPEMTGFAGLSGIAEIATRGPLTPDHVIRTKCIPLVLSPAADDAELARAVVAYAADYAAYFERHREAGQVMLDPAPRWAVWPGRGIVAFGKDAKDADVVLDIARHTARAIQRAEALGRWQALPEADLFRMEYWELEQRKLKKPGARPDLQGQVALVTGAAHGIGKATLQRLQQMGAMVVGLDRDPIVRELSSSSVLGIVCDVTDSTQVSAAVAEAVATFGGLDLLVSNAGTFPEATPLGELSDAAWAATLALNLDSHFKVLRAATPHLARGQRPSVVVVASKNVPAPGPGVAAYSVAKAGLTQLARVAALELGELGIRVNVIHPDAVFDTHLWDAAKIAARAANYGLTVEQYKARNILRREVRAVDVANLIARLLSNDFACTTGAQIPIDGGNNRVI